MGWSPEVTNNFRGHFLPSQLQRVPVTFWLPGAEVWGFCRPPSRTLPVTVPAFLTGSLPVPSRQAGPTLWGQGLLPKATLLNPAAALTVAWVGGGTVQRHRCARTEERKPSPPQPQTGHAPPYPGLPNRSSFPPGARAVGLLLELSGHVLSPRLALGPGGVPARAVG